MSDNPFEAGAARGGRELSIFDSRAGQRAASSTFLLGQVMFLVAIALAFAAAGTYIGRDLPFGTAAICEFGALGMLIVQMFVPALRAGSVGMVWMFALALLLGLGLGPVIANYAVYDRSALYEAAGGTALTVGAMGSFGFATSRDLIRWMRPLFWALLGVFGLSILLILIGSGEHLVLNIAIYVIVSAYLAIYFQLIRRVATERDVVWLATGVFINIVNIFLTLLRIFGNGR
jgi:modulator of FtsH protease